MTARCSCLNEATIAFKCMKCSFTVNMVLLYMCSVPISTESYLVNYLYELSSIIIKLLVAKIIIQMVIWMI